MENNTADTLQNAENGAFAAEADATTVPSSKPGWASHIPFLQPDHFPHSPTPFLYSHDHLNLPPVSSSPAFNLYLLNHHPAYAKPSESLGNAQQSHINPVVAPSGANGNGEGYPSQTDIAASVSHRAFTQPQYSMPYTTETPLTHSDTLQTRVGAVAHSTAHDTSWEPSFTALLESRDSLPPMDYDDPTLYSATQHEHTLNSLPANHQVAGSGTKFPPYNAEENDSDADDTDDDEAPVLTWPGRNRKRNADGSKAGRVGRPRGSGRGKRRKKGDNRGPRPVMDPGDAFMKVYNQAVDTFLGTKDLDKAQTLVIEAISANPEIFAAHSLLADIHFARGDHDAGIDVLMVGLHAHINDIELWRQVADTILSHNQEGHQKRIERAMYCYGAILRKSKKDLDARFQRAECARLLGVWNRAFSDLNMVMDDDPHNSAVLAQFASLCEDVNDIPKAVFAYEKHFDYYREIGLSDEEHFTWQDVGTYTDLLLKQGDTLQALTKLKQLSRWLCGRQDESFWDEYLGDDRELDQMHYPRRLEDPRFTPGRYPEQDYGEVFPLDLRGKLGVMRLKLNYRDEAQSHFAWLEPDLEGEESLVAEYSDTFYEIGKALHDTKEHEQALHFYKALYSEGIVLGLDFCMDMGASCHTCGERETAIELYLKALQLDPSNIDARTHLTNLYIDRGNKALALKYGKEGVLMAQSMISDESVVRKYERRDEKARREAAERALKQAFRLPDRGGKRPGKVPKGLRYRTRERRKFFKWVPDPEELEEYGESDPEVFTRPTRTKTARRNKASVRRPPSAASSISAAETERDSESGSPSLLSADEPPMYDRPIKIRRRNGRPPKAPRLPPSQENAVKHYEEMQQLYQTLLKYQNDMRDGNELAIGIWVDCANAMFQDFRSRRIFFPSQRHQKFSGYTTHDPRPRPAAALSASAQSPEAVGGSTDTRIPPTNSNTVNSFNDNIIPAEAATGPNEYCGLNFEIWLDIFLELAALHANSASSDGQTECYKLINSCLDCSIYYHNESHMVQIYSCFLSCCLALGDDITLYNTVLRWFMREYAFCTDTYRLYSAITLVNELPPVASQMQEALFKSAPNQKFVFRQIVSIDKLLPAEYNTNGKDGSVPAFMRKNREELRKLAKRANNNKNGAVIVDDDDNDDGDNTPGAHSHSIDTRLHMPQEMDVILFILYAHILMASGSFPNALSYLYRAYSLEPTNTVCLLSMALCYMHELFKRQTDNRHAYALAGWTWFGRYEEERMKWAEGYDRDLASGDQSRKEASALTGMAAKTSKERMIDVAKREIAFNKARCWQMLGMADLGMRGYKKVLDMMPRGSPSERGRDEDGEEVEDEWTMEAAYAMSTVYAIHGNAQRAREITEKYLVVE